MTTREEESDDVEFQPPSPKKKKVESKKYYSGAAIYKSKYQLNWKMKWPCVLPVKGDSHSFRCAVCYKVLSCAHQGEKDVKRHLNSTLHQNNVKAASTSKLKFPSLDPQNKISRAEVKIANALVQHNIPIAVMDHLSPLFKDIFPDSDIARGYASASTKTTCLINGSLAPHFKSQLVQVMQDQPFSIAVDGSNDNGLDKMNPMTVRIYDIKVEMIVTLFLDMCLTRGRDSATASAIFARMDQVLQENDIDWKNCIGVSVDNTSVNLGKRNSILTRVKEKNPAVFFMGCSCHILHNTCMKAEEKFNQITHFDVEEMMIDLFYYFDKSTKRKSGLSEYCTFCDIEFRQVIKHVSTRWLSLELAVTRTLQEYPALKSYFISEGNASGRAVRLTNIFSDPMTEVYLMFYQAILQSFVNFNKFLQVEYPIIPVILSQFNFFLKKLLGRFISVTAIQSADGDIASIDYSNASNQLPDNALFIGIMTRQLLTRYSDEGDISSQQVSKFYKAAREFLITSVSYFLSNIPINDEVLKNAEFANFENKEACTISQVTFFSYKIFKFTSFFIPFRP